MHSFHIALKTLLIVLGTDSAWWRTLVLVLRYWSTIAIRCVPKCLYWWWVQTVYSPVPLQGTCASWFLESGWWSRRCILWCKDFSTSNIFVWLHYWLLKKPNLLSADGTAIMGVCRFSPSGEYFVYGVSQLVGRHILIWANCLILVFLHREAIILPFMFALRAHHCLKLRQLKAETVDWQMKWNGPSFRL